MPRSAHPVRSVLVAVLGLVATVLVPVGPAAASDVKIDPRLFGVHDSDFAGSWPTVPVGAIRLWDAGVTWRDIETSPGVYDFSHLDAIVRAANARNAEVTLVLGQTPDFYATRSPAGASMPGDTGAWTRYIQALVSHYSPANWGSRGIAAYQVWNEANVVNFWTGSPEQLRQLTRLAYSAVKGVDPGALVIGPSMATRLAGQIRWINAFYYPVSGQPAVWKSMDAIGLHLYPTDIKTPEQPIRTLGVVRAALRLRGVPSSKPIWNTEINYGARTGGQGAASPISVERQAAYVMRTFLLNAAAGIQRVHWYSFDLRYLPSGGTLGNTLLTDPGNGSTLTLAGRSFGLVRGWMVGGTMLGSGTTRPCAKDRAGTYTCVIKYRGGVRRVYWNPTKVVKVRTAKNATYAVGVYGQRRMIKGGSVQRVDYRPLMVRSRS